MAEQKNDEKRMQMPDLSQKNTVLALDDEQLKQAVHNLAVAGGMDARKADAISQNAAQIREKLSSVTERDLEKLLSKISPAQLEMLVNHFKKRNKEGVGTRWNRIMRMKTVWRIHPGLHRLVIN